MTTMGTYVRMLRFGYTVTEHNPDRPWLVVGTSHGTVTLPDGESFFRWAYEHWPPPRWSIQLDPWELSPDGRPTAS